MKADLHTEEMEEITVLVLNEDLNLCWIFDIVGYTGLMLCRIDHILIP